MCPRPPALVNDNWTNLSFAQSVEFDNKDGIIANPAGNLLALSFGTTTTGGSLYAYPTVNRAPRGGVVLGSFIADFPGPVSTASRFFLGAPPYTETSPSLTLSRGQMGGLSVSPNNNLVAYTTATSADPLAGNVIGILEYSNTGDGTGTISDGFEFSDGGVTLAPNTTAGTAWLDNEYLLVAAPFNTLGNERVELSLFRVDASINSDLEDRHALDPRGRRAADHRQQRLHRCRVQPERHRLRRQDHRQRWFLRRLAGEHPQLRLGSAQARHHAAARRDLPAADGFGERLDPDAEHGP